MIGPRIVTSVLSLFASAIAHSDEVAPPQGAAVVGRTWCVFVSGQHGQFLREIARHIDSGAEIQGSVEYSTDTGLYSALVCRRGEQK
jgi:hypothetical protein